MIHRARKKHYIYNGGSFVHDAIRSIAGQIHAYGMSCLPGGDLQVRGRVDPERENGRVLPEKTLKKYERIIECIENCR